MYVISGNFGNHTIALMQWAFEQELGDVFIVSIDTGWAAGSWTKRVTAGETLARSYGFNVIRLAPAADFISLVKDRKEFPSQKFQWCSSFLKGLPLLEWLDKVDPDGSATMLYGKRRADSRLNWQLQEVIDVSEHHGDRKLWYPLYQHSDEQFIHLIKQTGFAVLNHRSLECDACINCSTVDFSRMEKNSILRLKLLEDELGKPMFVDFIKEQVTQACNKVTLTQTLEQFNMGCGSVYGCGE